MSLIYGFFTGSHSPTIALMKDGKIVSCLEEERMTTIKSGDNYDINCELAAEAIQKFTGVNIVDADYNVFVNPTPDAFAKEITNKGTYINSHIKNIVSFVFLFFVLVVIVEIT